MKIKLLLPWLCALGLLAGLAMLYSANRKQEAELLALRQESQELKQLRAEAESGRAQAQTASDELVRLRQENKDLLRLRNEVGQLRQNNQQLTRQTQRLQSQVESAQAQAQAARQSPAQPAQLQLPGQPPGVTQALAASPQGMSDAEAVAFRQRYGMAPAAATPEQANANACINNLRQIDGAKQQWALENRKSATAIPAATDIAPYLKNLPTCPAGGVYTMNAVEIPPTCSIQGHALPK